MIEVPPRDTFKPSAYPALLSAKVEIWEKIIGKSATTLRRRAPRRVILPMILPIYLEVGSPGRMPG